MDSLPDPAECHFVPLFEEDRDANLKYCIAVRRYVNSTDGVFFLIQTTDILKKYLGAVTNYRGEVVKWLEIYLQSFHNFHVKSNYSGLNNTLLDGLWFKSQKGRNARTSEKLMTKWAGSNPPPTFYDPEKRSFVKPLFVSDSDNVKYTWQLCRDDELLKENGLQPYSLSLERYLYTKENNKFCQTKVSEEKNIPENSFEVNYLYGDKSLLVPFNLHCGFIDIKEYRGLGNKFLLGLVRYEENIEEKIQKLPDISGSEENDRSPFLPNGGYSSVWTKRNMLWNQGGQKIWRKSELFLYKWMLFEEILRQYSVLLLEHQHPLGSLENIEISVSQSKLNIPAPNLWTLNIKLELEPNTFCLFENDEISIIKSISDLIKPLYTATTVAEKVTLELREMDEGGRSCLVSVEGDLPENICDYLYVSLEIHDWTTNNIFNLYGKLVEEKIVSKTLFRFECLNDILPQSLTNDLKQTGSLSLNEVKLELIKVDQYEEDLRRIAAYGCQLIFLPHVQNRELVDGYLNQYASLAEDLLPSISRDKLPTILAENADFKDIFKYANFLGLGESPNQPPHHEHVVTKYYFDSFFRLLTVYSNDLREKSIRLNKFPNSKAYISLVNHIARDISATNAKYFNYLFNLEKYNHQLHQAINQICEKSSNPVG